MEAPLELRLYGPAALLRDGQPIHPRARKALALLALLAVDGPQPREALAAWLWPALESAAARRNLRREVFRLRELGVRFDDAERGGRLSLEHPLPAESDAASAAAGAPLAWLAEPEPGEEALAGWLRERRALLATRQQRHRLAEAREAHERGDVESALARVEAMLDADPCDEQALDAAMQWLAATNRPARALAWYGLSAAALRDRLGVEPSAALQRMADTLRAPAPQAQRLFAERVPFVPRTAATAAILQAWAQRRPVWLAGVSGVGKSRLAAECAATQGPWLQVACSPSDRVQPWNAVVRLLRALRAAAPDVALPGWVERELSQLLPELGPPPAQTQAGEEQARARLRSAIDAALGLLAADNYAVLVLDDWQWADDLSAEAWSTHAAAPPATLRLTCHRSAQLPPPALAQMRREVDGGHAAWVELQGFDADETLALTHALSNSPGGRLFSRRLQRATGGNPFFLIETLRHLHQQGLLRVDEHGRWSTPFDDATQDYAELPVPASVRDAVLARVRALGLDGERLLQLASLLDGPPDSDLLAAAAGLAPAAVHGLLEHAGAARLLEDHGGTWHYAHDLVRQCLADAQPARLRRQRHRQLAAALQARGAPPAVLAEQFERAGEPSRAVEHRLRAGDAAWRVHAMAQAGEHWRAALADHPAPEQAVQAWLSLARLHRRAADAPALQASIDAALAAAAQAPADARRGARLACAELWVGAHRAEAALALLDAIEGDLAAAPARERAKAHALRATLAGWGGNADAAMRHYEAAFGLLQGVPDALVTLGDLLDSASRTLVTSGRSAEAQAYARRAVATLEAAGEPIELAGALVMDGVCALHVQGDRAAAVDRFERSRALARRWGLVPAQRAAILNLVKLHADAGRSDVALALLEEGEGLAPWYEHLAAEQAFLQARYYIHCLRGETGLAEVAADHLVAMARREAEQQILLGSLHLVSDLAILSGRHDHAEALLAEAQSLIRGGAGQGWQATVGCKRAWLALERGDVARARELLPAAAAVDRADARALRAWVASAVALAEGDLGGAAAELRDHPPHTEAATDLLAMLLVQHLRVARAAGLDDAEPRARAEALLAAGAVPALEAARLRATLNDADQRPINASPLA